jgi:hypothetical protein
MANFSELQAISGVISLLMFNAWLKDAADSACPQRKRCGAS